MDCMCYPNLHVEVLPPSVSQCVFGNKAFKDVIMVK